MVRPGQLDEAVGHAGLAQPARQVLGLFWRHYVVVAAVGEEGRRVAGVDAGYRREQAVASGYGLGVAA